MRYDIAALKRKMLVKYPFFGSVVANVNYKENIDIRTAATDGETIYYNPTFLESISVEEQTFILAHEVCHIAFNHILRSEGKDPKLWNIATDGVINQFLKKDGLKMVEGGVDIAEAINYDAEQLYEKLLKEKQEGSQQNEQDNMQNQQSNQQQNNGNEEKQEDVGHDTHSMWEKAVKKQKEEQENSNNDKKEKLWERVFKKEKIEQKPEPTELEKKKDELKEMGEKKAFEKNSEDRKKQLEELKAAISRQASRAGTSTNRDIRNVNNIGTAKPIVDWRYVLREAIKYDVDWSYKNATIEDNVVVPYLEELPKPETEIVLDTSGSINEVLLKNFLRECKNILQHTKLKVGCFDTEFYGFHDIRTEEDIENMTFVGGGGTDFNVAVESFSNRVENKIIFTDGEAPMPDTQLNAIWIVFGGKEIKPKGGRVIHITPEQLDRLCSYVNENEKIR